MAISFIVYDLIFLVAFTLFVIVFLYTHRKNLEKEGLLYLYRTKLGLKIIDRIGRKYRRTLKVLSFVSITMGYTLMAMIVYMMIKVVYFYYAFPSIVRAIKVPPLITLVPYLPAIFKIDFLPPFYFTYWILIIAIIAITHEMAHGIYARYFNIKVKSTGFGFLGPFLAAFVEPDEKDMAKKGIFPQLVILSAGTFANILTAMFFFVILVLYFSAAFTPAGLIFNTYSYAQIPISEINNYEMLNGTFVSFNSNKSGLLQNAEARSLIAANLQQGLTEIKIKNNKSYFIDINLVEINRQSENESVILAYYDSPAVREQLQGAIISINEVPILSREDLQRELEKYIPGQRVMITTQIDEGNQQNYSIVLGKHPLNENVSFLGVGFVSQEQRGVFGKVSKMFTAFKSSSTYYRPAFDGVSIFVYNLLWWIILISISVALVNMLPLGLFDGGRFFYLTVLAITRSESFAKKSFTFMTYFFLFLLALLMVFWALAFL